MMTLEETLKLNLKLAGDMIVKQGHLTPMFVLISPKETNIIVTPWETNEQKNIICDMVKAKMHKDGVVRYVHMAEAWMAFVNPDTDRAVARLTPSQREDKQEIVVVSVSDKHKTISGLLNIHRNGQGKVVSTSIAPMSETSEIGGRMVSLLREDVTDEILERFEREILKNEKP